MMVVGETELVVAVLQQWIKDALKPDSDAFFTMQIMKKYNSAALCPALCWIAAITGKEPLEVLQIMMDKVRHIRQHPDQIHLARYEHPVLKGNALAHEKGDYSRAERRQVMSKRHNLARKQKQKESALTLALAATG